MIAVTTLFLPRLVFLGKIISLGRAIVVMENVKSVVGRSTGIAQRVLLICVSMMKRKIRLVIFVYGVMDQRIENNGQEAGGHFGRRDVLLCQVTPGVSGTRLWGNGAGAFGSL